MKYVLIEVIEREISPPAFFKNFELAYAEMKRRFDFSNSGDGEIHLMSAYCENLNHDNCDWKIFNI